MTVGSIVGSIISGTTQGIGAGGGFDPLAFHALADVDGVFVNDVIRGIGAYTEANTSTRYYADNTATPIWQPFTSGQQAKTFAGSKWWSVGQKATTNDQIQSATLTDVEWTATNMTVTKDQVGMRGDANGACLLVATAANATVVANAITDASDDQCTRWFIERGVGTGGVELSVDGQVSWVDVTASVDSAAGFNECLADQAALANPQIAIRLVVDTDEVIVGNAEAFLGDMKEEIRQSSPVFTVATPVSIGASDLSVDDANHDNTQGLWSCELRNSGITGAVIQGGLLGIGINGRFLYINTVNQVKSFESTNNPNASVSPNFNADDNEYKFAMAYGQSKYTVIADGSAGTELAYDGDFPNTLGHIEVIGSSALNGSDPRSTIMLRDIRRYDQSHDAGVTNGLIITA